MIITRTCLVEQTEDIDIDSHEGYEHFVNTVVQDETIADEYIARLREGETIEVNTDNPRWVETYEVHQIPSCLLSLRSGVRIESDSDTFIAGAYVRIINADGLEIGYWTADEWRDDPELVMGAILMCAMRGEPQHD